MELTEKELAYLKLYKGVEDGIYTLYPNLPKGTGWLIGSNLGFNPINSLLNFVFTKDPTLLRSTRVKYLDDMLDMIFTLSDVACRYALENPTIDYELYRYDHQSNIPNYNNGLITSFKSTSQSKGEVQVFNEPGHVPLSFEIDGFTPYIDVDGIVDTNLFSDEKEILFPPCLRGFLTGDTKEVNGVSYHTVMLSDVYGEEFSDTVEHAEELYNSIKENFQKELKSCKAKGEVSETLEEYCSIIAHYIYIKLRTMYQRYAKEYQEAKESGFTKP